MDFRILGPLEVRDEDREVRLRGGKQRALLALLLVNANRTLAIDRIVDDLWGEDVPETAAKMVQIYVSRIRKVLGAEALHTRPPGYALQLEPGELDLHRFERLLGEAREALDEGRAEEASRGFQAALALWRGPALAEFTSEPFAPAEEARLEELRVSALEGRLEADLLLGRPGDLVGELEALIGRYPLREGLRRQQMLALYRSGRQAEALAAYQEARRALADELGIEPSPTLRELERMILQQDAGLELAASPSALPVPAAAPEPSGDAAPEEMLKLVTVLVADAGSATPAQAPPGGRPRADDRLRRGDVGRDLRRGRDGRIVRRRRDHGRLRRPDGARGRRRARRSRRVPHGRAPRALERGARPGGHSRAPHRPEHGRGPRLERPRRGSPYRRRRGHPRRTAPADRRARRDRGRRAHRPGRAPALRAPRARGACVGLARRGRTRGSGAAGHRGAARRPRPRARVPSDDSRPRAAGAPAGTRHRGRRRGRWQEQARARAHRAARGPGNGACGQVPPWRAGQHARGLGRDAEGGGGHPRHGSGRRGLREGGAARRGDRRPGPRRRAVAHRACAGLHARAAARRRLGRARPTRALPRSRRGVAGAARLLGAARAGRRGRRGPALGRLDHARRARRARRAAGRANPLPVHRAPGPERLAAGLGRGPPKPQLVAARPVERRRERAPRLVPPGG